MTAMAPLGYLLRKFDFETAPVVLGLILAPMLEMSFRQSAGDVLGELRDLRQSCPIASVMLFCGLALLLLSSCRSSGKTLGLAAEARNRRPQVRQKSFDRPPIGGE